ncbi:MAG: CRISPR-associated protein Cas4 [Candidatus Sulfopaludibacter sp.]|nr:CRISPR-associated protein Cas4 [Candidatus Sulfopaludibacter sp.]
MVFDEDDLLPLSGLQHLVFCERQWGLIHIEQMWTENRLTAEGRALHERAHEAGSESRPGRRIARGLRLHSLRLGLSGEADVVEFHEAAGGVVLSGEEGRWQPFPVEYKRGRPKVGGCDRVQLCAQALCLEEMFAVPVLAGALYYGTPRRRQEVPFTAQLRRETEALAARMHELYRSRRTPFAEYSARCEKCSLLATCLPKSLGKSGKVERYLAGATSREEEVT